jgi:predicted chitinase/peptidoglycan hydrolase-like protein with peptidoglycan-binding domain
MTAPVSRHRATTAAQPKHTPAAKTESTATTGTNPAWSPKTAGARKSAGAAPTEQALAEAMRTVADANPPLKAGARGENVADLQRALHALGYPVTADSIFGPHTEAALESFAHNNKLALGPKGALSPQAANALALKLENGAVAGAVTRLSSTFLSQNPHFFAGAESAFRGIAAEKDPAKKKQLLDGWLDSVTKLANEHGAALTAAQPDWKQDWDLVSRHAKDLAGSGQGGGDLRTMERTFADVAKNRVASNIATLSDGLRKQDPKLAQQFLAVIDRMETADPKKGTPVEDLASFMHEVKPHARDLPPDARRAWLELENTVLDASRTGQTKALADFMGETFVRHTLEAVHADPNNPAQLELTKDLRARLQKLEQSADAAGTRQVTGQQLRGVVPTLSAARADELAVALSAAMDKAKISTTRERAAFIAQCAAETGGFKWFHELGKDPYFDKYDNRRDLGNHGHPDGSTFKGRGALMLTGRSNYTDFSKWYSGDTSVVRHPEQVENPDLAFASASWFWTTRGLNRPADANDFRAVTERINGGFNGWDERVRLYAKALNELAHG